MARNCVTQPRLNVNCCYRIVLLRKIHVNLSHTTIFSNWFQGDKTGYVEAEIVLTRPKISNNNWENTHLYKFAEGKYNVQNIYGFYKHICYHII